MSHDSEPILTFRLTPDGLVPTDYQAASLVEAVAYEPQGVYTVARTFYGDRALLLDAHLDRLEESAHLVGIPLQLDRARLRAALRELLARGRYPDAKFRVTVPRENPEHLVFALEPFHPVPEDVMQGGAHIITLPIVRPQPDAKTTDWMAQRRPAYESLPPGVYEGVIVAAGGRLLEGLSSNIYGVLDGVLRTAGQGVLAGITRRAIYDLAPQVLPVQLEPLHIDDIPRLSEAMLTSSGRGIVPVTRINEHPVGGGAIGPVVRQLQVLYDAWVAAHSEPI